MKVAVRIVPKRDPGTDIRCPACGRKNGTTIIPGGRHQIACKRCNATIDFETWPDDYVAAAASTSAERVVVSRARTPASGAGFTTSRPGAALSKG